MQFPRDLTNERVGREHSDGGACGERADFVLSLFEAYYERVYAFLRKSTSPDVAEDLAQEVFVRLLQHPHLERLTISVSYLLKIAHNLLRRRYTRASRLRALLDERGHTALRTDAPRCDGDRALIVDAASLRGALGQLTSEERNAVHLIVCEGKSYRHAAESLGVSIATVNNWKHRGLMKLRRHLHGRRESEQTGTSMRLPPRTRRYAVAGGDVA